MNFISRFRHYLSAESLSSQFHTNSYIFNIIKYYAWVTYDIGKTDRTLFIQTCEHVISDKESAMHKHLHTREHFIFIPNLCNLPDTLNSDNVPPDLSCNKQLFPAVEVASDRYLPSREAAR